MPVLTCCMLADSFSEGLTAEQNIVMLTYRQYTVQTSFY
jgi:hypothetical protein